jgi:hypothetical protein
MLLTHSMMVPKAIASSALISLRTGRSLVVVGAIACLTGCTDQGDTELAGAPSYDTHLLLGGIAEGGSSANKIKSNGQTPSERPLHTHARTCNNQLLGPGPVVN